MPRMRNLKLLHIKCPELLLQYLKISTIIINTHVCKIVDSTRNLGYWA